MSLLVNNILRMKQNVFYVPLDRVCVDVGKYKPQGNKNLWELCLMTT